MSLKKSVWTAVLVLTAIFVRTSLQDSPQGNLDPCPAQCKCSLGRDRWWYGVIVSCEKKNLTSVPLQYPAKTKSLKLNNNQLKNLSEGSFSHTPILNGLYLGNNQLKDLPENIFRENTELRWLELQDNQLKYLPKGIFRNNTKLGLLDLSYNQLQNLSDGLFERCRWLFDLEERDLQFKNYLKEELDPGLIIINKTRNRAV